MREKIIAVMQEIAKDGDLKLVNPLSDNIILLESGLDSLAFAILVIRLEEDLGYDPFTLMEEPIYPRTLGEFVSIYQRFDPSHDH